MEDEVIEARCREARFKGVGEPSDCFYIIRSFYFYTLSNPIRKKVSMTCVTFHFYWINT